VRTSFSEEKPGTPGAKQKGFFYAGLRAVGRVELLWVSVSKSGSGTGNLATLGFGWLFTRFMIESVRRKARYGMTKTAEPRFIETTAGQIAAELTRLGIAPDQHVTVAIQPDDWLAEVREFTRPSVIAEGWSDADIDRIIDEERENVQPHRG
jgi:hypothetical protein